MANNKGRPREVGDQKWATITEAAEALKVSKQAIYRRRDAGTIPYEEHVDPETGKHSYRVNRRWLEAEVLRKKSTEAATTGEIAREADNRMEEVFQALANIGESIRAEVETQHTTLTPLLREISRELSDQEDERKERFVTFASRMLSTSESLAEGQKRLLGGLEAIRSGQNEMYRQVRSTLARAEEEARREKEYQELNLELQRENRDLQKQILDLLSRVEEAERERQQSGRQERRSFWRRLFATS